VGREDHPGRFCSTSLNPLDDQRRRRSPDPLARLGHGRERDGDVAQQRIVVEPRDGEVFRHASAEGPGRGDDLEREVPVTLGEALLGGEIPVSTLKGRVLLKVPAGTQNGRTFRLAGQGMPRFNAEGFGDLLVKVRIVVPTHLSDDAADAARRFLDLVNEPDPRAG